MIYLLGGLGGLGIGDWGFGDWAQSPIPNPQSPIPNPQSPLVILNNNISLLKKINLNISLLN